MKNQKQVFLDQEANQWFERNRSAIQNRNMPDDDFIASTLQTQANLFANSKILEIGCADGFRLKYLKGALNAEVYGIDPSASAVQEGINAGLDLKVGTADKLDFEDGTFDIVILGFCLYLCDRRDLFKIAAEIDRVTQNQAWIVIQDFFSETDYSNDYSHFAGIKSYKSDYRKMFTWNPDYTCVQHKITDHSNFKNYTDKTDEWIALSIIRKNFHESP